MSSVPSEDSVRCDKPETLPALGRVGDDIREPQRAGNSSLDDGKQLQLLLNGITDFAIYTLDPEGYVISWNLGAARITGYQSDEILGKNFSCFYAPDDIASGKPAAQLRIAVSEGRFEEEGWRFRKDGSTFLANVVITPMYDDSSTLRGFCKVTRDITVRNVSEEKIRNLNEELDHRVTQLEAANKELEAFTYSVSHDLRAPLRHISGFSRILIEESAGSVPAEASRYLERIADGARKMGVLLDELLALAGVGRHALSEESVNLNSLVDDVVNMLSPEIEGRLVEWKIADLGSVHCDLALLRQVFQNLIANALKFTRPRATAMIEIGCMEDRGESTFFVRDNGVGFDMKYADKLFGVFQRLHNSEDFEGTGIGLATVRRIIQKHAGRTWAEAELGKGATFYFTTNVPIEAEGKTNSAAAGVQS